MREQHEPGEVNRHFKIFRTETGSNPWNEKRSKGKSKNAHSKEKNKNSIQNLTREQRSFLLAARTNFCVQRDKSRRKRTHNEQGVKKIRNTKSRVIRVESYSKNFSEQIVTENP